MSQIPEQLKYTKEHEWATEADGVVTVGITAHAVEQLGDVTLVDLPPVGTAVTAGQRFGDIESVKTVSELFAPVSGKVVAINEDLEEQPELVNEAPYEGGWMVRIEVAQPGATDALLDAAAYEAYLGELDH